MLDIDKTKSNKTKDYLIAFQKMILDITFDFMNINQENYDERVNNLLENIGCFFELERMYLFTINDENDTMIYSHHWCNVGVKPLLDINKEIALDALPWWVEQLNQNNLIHIEDVNLLPSEARVEEEHLVKKGVKSIVSVPISVGGKVEAFMGVDSAKSTGKWSDEKISLFHVVADILSKGITQLNYDKKINFMINHDLLTKLPNRLLLTSKLEEGIQQASFDQTPISVVFINLDRFKRINDQLGYHHGDSLLKQIAERLLDAVSKKDTVSRTDNDQYILYLREYESEKSLDFIISKIIDVFKKPFILRGEEYIITASMGLSQYPKDGEDVETLIESSYIAMGKAKNLGKDRFLKYTDVLKKEAQETLSLTKDLYHAINRDQMMLYYQPQVNIESGKIEGMEALLRWKHPELGFIPPFKFIALAERTRLILPIGDWVLQAACKQWSEWQENGLEPIKISVNFSPHQLTHPGIVEQVADALESNSMPAEYLIVEITENAAMENSREVKDTLKRIQEMGVALSLDDYGKEYSSLNRLKEASMSVMKVDMSFIQGIGINKKDEIIVESILALASDLGLTSIAEGVETQEQLDFLYNTSCDLIQGYYFYKPMPADEIVELLASKSVNIL